MDSLIKPCAQFRIYLPGPRKGIDQPERTIDIDSDQGVFRPLLPQIESHIGRKTERTLYFPLNIPLLIVDGLQMPAGDGRAAFLTFLKTGGIPQRELVLEGVYHGVDGCEDRLFERSGRVQCFIVTDPESYLVVLLNKPLRFEFS